MPKDKSNVWNYFKRFTDKSKLCGKCIYCDQTYVSNATKMRKHLKKCMKTPENVRLLAANNFPENRVDAESTNSCSSITTSVSRNISMEAFVDRISKQEQADLDVAYARSVYSMALPLSISDNGYYREFISTLRPAYKLPSRKQLSSTLLDAEFERIKKSVNKKIDSSKSLALVSDGWTDINGMSIINIIFTTPEPVFIKGIYSGADRHTGDNIFKMLSKEIENIGPQKVHAVVTDNAPNMKLAWALIKEKYPHIITYGCAAHSLNLLAKDFAEIPKVSATIAEGKKIVQYFNNKQVPKYVFQKEQKARKINKTLKVPVETRWNTFFIMIDSLIANKSCLQGACFDQDLMDNVDPTIKRYLLSEDTFWDNVMLCHTLLKPVSDAITKIEGDLPKIGQIYSEIKNIYKNVDLVSEKFSLAHGMLLTEILKNREDFLFKDIFLAAHFLCPINHVVQKTNENSENNSTKSPIDNLSDEEVEVAMNFILDMGAKMKINCIQVATDIAEFRSKSGLWENEIYWQAAETMTPITWWKGFFPNKALFKIAVRILNFPATSAAAERNFKTFANIKTKKRNRLTLERTEKLVFIKYNLNLNRDLTKAPEQAPEGTKQQLITKVIPVNETMINKGASTSKVDEINLDSSFENDTDTDDEENNFEIDDFVNTDDEAESEDLDLHEEIIIQEPERQMLETANMEQPASPEIPMPQNSQNKLGKEIFILSGKPPFYIVKK